MGKKISIIGAGFVGATIAYTLTTLGTASEIVLVDLNTEKARGEALDIMQSTPFSATVNVRQGMYEDIVGSDIVVFTAGIGRKPGQTRIDLVKTNVGIIKSIMPNVVQYAPNAIYVIVSNPVDIITYIISKFPGVNPAQVVGTGTLLDTARLRAILSEKSGVQAKNIHAYVLGEHGDTSFIPWSGAAIAGVPVNDFKGLENLDKQAVWEDMRTGGAKVIAAKGATYFAIALSTQHLCDNILRDTRAILPVATVMQGQYGVSDIAISLPSIITKNGVSSTIELPMNQEEVSKFKASAIALKSIINEL